MPGNDCNITWHNRFILLRQMQQNNSFLCSISVTLKPTFCNKACFGIEQVILC